MLNVYVRWPAVRDLKRVSRSVWVRWLVSLTLLIAVLSQLDAGSIRAAVQNGRWELFAAASATLFLAFVVGAARWHSLLAYVDLRTRFITSARAYFAGLFVSNFLPGAIAGDVSRILIVAGPGTRVRSSTSVLFDRFTILVVAIGLAWASVPPAGAPKSLVLALAISTGAVVCGCVVLVLSAGGVAALRRYVPASLRVSEEKPLLHCDGY